jgi:hypothetical protein
MIRVGIIFAGTAQLAVGLKPANGNNAQNLDDYASRLNHIQSIQFFKRNQSKASKLNDFEFFDAREFC